MTESDTLEADPPLSRRTFVRNAATGIAGIALTLGRPEQLLAGQKDSGEVTLDALLISYIAAPLGTTGSSLWTPESPYSITFGVHSQTSSDIRLKARVNPDEHRISSDAAVRQAVSERARDAIRVFPRRNRNETLSIGTPPPGVPENTTFYGLSRPVLRFKGDGGKANFRLVRAESTFGFNAQDVRNHFNEETASSIISQYVFDETSLQEPRFLRVGTSDAGKLVFVQRAERSAPRNITSTVTATIIDQSGFETDALREAFAPGSSLAVTYYSAEESRGRILRFETSLDRTTIGLNGIFWDRVFKTFVITDQPG